MVNISAKLDVSASNMKEYYVYYLAKHSKQWTRRVHLVGTVVGAVGVAASVARLDAIGAAVSAAVGTAICWAGDAAVEKTQPTTFKNPLWSVYANFKMVGEMISGKMSI
ncbi:hypothetical protein ABB37_08268 [Leptomonas pyrrhocoris]|uniref:Uncharacterized protein n=1 Tax=Leptomonas pyrrhocoris TaxID=157538 RepID=A0A0M9FTF4_LEPPY|nr:hypothetical protein ABB37_08268 [Leptomonas pyrrhocoris]XP_015654158.1 hypothetical protein ABB37_08268 [Leptomonas pyrrhocoris]XP_015654159.1 hypothetical protein ABB37_08268 [Leptomonas pyrrhocoris]KPA75718.1 hypothetical protein ABB37_08268 [Leptomonas pyrrhocoris]KPA75719.1 hypothetical protein ABB37_08268 [Leptomonas pyrrhocoris]KPA75720.1 hypothetical protein ABB37_08268 [Leptomonas pyrrhocoris]|eukprot:XP_015654157.1 hypothetical protein ABB37_08268 [Leptomonas pyrrhocoris]